MVTTANNTAQDTIYHTNENNNNNSNNNNNQPQTRSSTSHVTKIEPGVTTDDWEAIAAAARDDPEFYAELEYMRERQLFFSPDPLDDDDFVDDEDEVWRIDIAFGMLVLKLSSVHSPSVNVLKEKKQVILGANVTQKNRKLQTKCCKVFVL